MAEPIILTCKKDLKKHFRAWTDEQTGLRFCGRKKTRCHACGHKFTAAERYFATCPECLTDRRCRVKVAGDAACRYHDRNYASGPRHPNWKGGATSRVFHGQSPLPGFPREVQDAYLRATNSADMRTVMREYGILQARLQMLAERLESGESNKIWRQLEELAAKWETAILNQDDGDEAIGVMHKIVGMIKQGAQEKDKWEEILRINRDSAQLKSLQAQIEKDNQAVLTASQAMNFVVTLSRSVREAMSLIRDRYNGLATKLRDRTEIELIADEVALSIEAGHDARGAIVEGYGRIVDSVPMSNVEVGFEEAGDIIQANLKAMIPK